MLYLLFFFFNQKTAYEMRISDWSSDVCSSDLFERGAHFADALFVTLRELGQPLAQGVGEALLQVGALAARLARVFGQRFAQHVQALVGAGAEFGQARAEAFDALRLRAGQAVELLAQLAAAVALLLAPDRQSVVEGKSVSVSVDLGGRRLIKKKKNTN